MTLRLTSTHLMEYTTGQRQKLVKMLPISVCITPLSNLDWLQDVAQTLGSGMSTMEISASLEIHTDFGGLMRLAQPLYYRKQNT